MVHEDAFGLRTRLTPRQLARLTAITARLESPHAGEREAARLAAEAFLRAHGGAMVPVPAASGSAAPSAAPVTPMRLLPGQDRRRAHRPYQGYERRRRPMSGRALNLSV